jgi:flagellar brake protein
MADNLIKTSEENYVVQNHKEILQIIHGLKDEMCSLKVSFNQDQEDYLTTIIDADDDYVYLDMSIDEAFNKRMLASSELLIYKDYGIRVKWQSLQHTKIELSDGNALRLELPEELVRLQRREFFRLKTPIVEPIVCNIPLVNILKPEVEEIVQYNLVDISLSGLAIISNQRFHSSFIVGAIFEHCKINLPDAGEVSLNLEVKYITQIEAYRAKDNYYRIGFEHKNSSHSDKHKIHKYTQHLERALLAAKG